ncbi:hypothetical protein ABKV19_006765, partial [Rosa sericea]
MQLGGVTLFFLFIFSLLPSQYAVEVYNITPSHPLPEGQTLVSPGLIFELGFFSPNSSANKYVGLWHKSIYPRKYVWVANRDNPLAATDTLVSLRIGSSGSLELVDGKQISVWSANISNCSSAVLLDNGNFVVKDDMGADMWESFNNPSDSLLPSMVGKQIFLTSWKSDNDPSTGIFKVELSAELPSQSFIWINGSIPYWRSGPWDQSKYIGVTPGTRYNSYSFNKIPGDKVLTYMDISSEGVLRQMFSESGKNWYLDWESWKNPCDNYGACGPFGVCKASDSPICKCLKGFIPKSNEEWSKRNWTGGCVRRTNLSCETNTNDSVSSKGKDGFFKLERLKVPDFHEYMNSVSLDKLEDCKIQCLSNCSCLAYAYVDNLGCLVWSKDLIDMQKFPSDGEDLYVRLAPSELDEEKPIKLIASLTAIGFMSILIAIVFSLHMWRANQKRNVKLTTRRLESTSLIKIYKDGLREYIGQHDSSELKIYDFDSISIATDNFSITNKLGQGGFGPVYKGMLPEGKEIAVKRLSSSSRQGVEEFKNEMLLISSLQHKNLVRMMGCCVKENEKLLIYEFMPNKSLDTFLYDPTKRAMLDWASLFNIIQGVARGCLYLHHDSYVKVIHRDLKVSNILLDEKMNPKISDFGLARIVEETQSLENTQKVVGTRGYMSPEYAMGGIFSEKSDVYSFGVLAWKLWNEGRALELVDEVLGDSYFSSEVMRCVHVGLLCVQDNAADRPTMTDVVSILSSEKDGSHPKSLLPSQYAVEVYNITPSHPLPEGQTLVSPGLIFELGFFSPNSSANKYVGLWHKSIYPRKYVWVANRDNPLAATDTLVSLRIGSSGSLELVDGKQISVWSANISNCSSAVLLDNGNFVVKDDMGADMWESFNNPSDSLLPSMVGKQIFLTSWKSDNDPSTGIFKVELSAELPSQSFIWINGSIPYWRSGPWDQSKYIGVTPGTRYNSYSFNKIPGDKVLTYMDISSEGVLRQMFSESGKNWYLDWESWKNSCDNYGACGPFGVCKASDSPICKCLKGFIPKSNEEWSKRNWTGGCVRRTNLSCETNTNDSVSSKGKDGFFKLERLKVPDFHEYMNSVSLDKLEDCKIQCLSNCSCLAYAYVDNLGCLVWSKDLIDMQKFPSDGEDLYVRLAPSELDEEKPIKLIASPTAIGFMSILIAIVFSLHRWRANQKRNVKLTTRRLESTSLIKIYKDGLREYIGQHDSSELKIYDFDSISIATDNFSITNKLGQGSFGPVYKGMLPEGKEIAVKRLSSSSRQGVEEFKNEMLLISSLQHKNLVRMMGCCVKENEKLLIYEFMPNKSLDTFLY